MIRRAMAVLLVAGSVQAGVALPETASPVELLQNAVDAYFEERYEDSLLIYREILDIDPGNVAAQKGLRTARRLREQQVAAQRRAEKPNFDAVTAYLAQGRLVEASDRLRDIETRLVGHPDLLELSEKVRVKAEKAVAKAKPESGDRYYAEGVAAYLREDWFKAVASWGQVVKFDPGRLDVQAKIARARKNLAEQERRDRIQVLLDVGRELVRQRLYAEAVKACTDALALDQKNAEARLCLDEARRGAVQEMVQARSDELQRMLEKAMGAFTSGEEKVAAELFARVLEKDPGNRVAAEYLNRIQGRDPGFAPMPGIDARPGAGNFQRGTQYLSQGQYVEAIEAFERHVAASPDDLRGQQMLEEARAKQRELAESAYREGLSRWVEGDIAAAKALWEKTLGIDPNYAKAKQALVKSKREESKH